MNTMGTTYGPAGGSTTRTSGQAPPGEIKSDLLDFAKKMAERRFVPGQAAAPQAAVGSSTMSSNNRPSAATVYPTEAEREQELLRRQLQMEQLKQAKQQTAAGAAPTYQKNAWGQLELSDESRLGKEYRATGAGHVSMGFDAPSAADAASSAFLSKQRMAAVGNPTYGAKE